MKISSRVTFYGNCGKAIEFYKEVFQIEGVDLEVDIETFEETSELENIELSEEDKKLIYKGELNVKSGDNSFSMIMGDSPTVIFNKSNVTNKNNIDNTIFEISGITEEQLKSIYDKLVAEGKSNIAPQVKGSYKLYASVIDKHRVCWNLCC